MSKVFIIGAAGKVGRHLQVNRIIIELTEGDTSVPAAVQQLLPG